MTGAISSKYALMTSAGTSITPHWPARLLCQFDNIKVGFEGVG